MDDNASNRRASSLASAMIIQTHHPHPLIPQVHLPPPSFGHTVLRLWLGPDSFLVKVSSEKEVAFWMTKLNSVDGGGAVEGREG